MLSSASKSPGVPRRRRGDLRAPAPGSPAACAAARFGRARRVLSGAPGRLVSPAPSSAAARLRARQGVTSARKQAPEARMPTANPSSEPLPICGSTPAKSSIKRSSRGPARQLRLRGGATVAITQCDRPPIALSRRVTITLRCVTQRAFGGTGTTSGSSGKHQTSDSATRQSAQAQPSAARIHGVTSHRCPVSTGRGSGPGRGHQTGARRRGPARPRRGTCRRSPDRRAAGAGRSPGT